MVVILNWINPMAWKIREKITQLEKFKLTEGILFNMILE